MNKNRQLSQKRCVVGQKANVFFLTYPCTFDFTTIQKKLVYRFGFETMQTALGNFIFLNKNRHRRSVDGGILVWWLFSRYFPKIWNLNLPKLLTDRKKLTGARCTTSSKTIPKSVHICPISSKRLFLTIFSFRSDNLQFQRVEAFSRSEMVADDGSSQSINTVLKNFEYFSKRIKSLESRKTSSELTKIRTDSWRITILISYF